MKKLAIVFALGAAALMGSSAANADGNPAKASTGAAESRTVTHAPTDLSSQHRHRHWRGHHRHHRHWGHHHHRHWGHHHRPYYNSYGYYAPRSYGYGGPRYYGGGPGVTFSFGGGRW